MQHTTKAVELGGEGICTTPGCGRFELFRNSAGHCNDCHNRQARQWQIDRKAQLAAEPRCETTGCKRRGSWHTYAGVLLCGQHLNNVKRHHGRTMAQLGGMGLFMPGISYSREEILTLATMRVPA